MSKHSFRGIVYISAMPWQERGFMLYTNEEPLVQRTCIKTASLQSEEISSMGTEESEIKRAVNGEVYTPEEISKLKEAREKIENPKSDTIMQKVAAVDTGV